MQINPNEHIYSSTMNNLSGKVYLIIELIQRSLSNTLEAKILMSIFFSFIDVIYQFARRIYYLHDMKIAY